MSREAIINAQAGRPVPVGDELVITVVRIEGQRVVYKIETGDGCGRKLAASRRGKHRPPATPRPHLPAKREPRL